MASWTGYYIQVDGLSDFADAANSTQNSVSLVGPYLADDGASDGTPTINGADVVESFVMTSGIVITIDGTDYTTGTAALGWELANGDMVFSPDFSGSKNQAIVDALNASGGVIDSIEFGFVGSNNLATPTEDYSLSTARYGGPICFTVGTKLRTPDGDKPIDSLRIGDTVDVCGSDAQPILWIGASTFHFTSHCDRHKPVLLPKNCFGHQVPYADLVVSPQHGILVEVRGEQFLLPARRFVGQRGIRTMRGQSSVTYMHIMLGSHQVIFSEGLASETFYPGPVALRMLGANSRREIASAFGKDLSDVQNGYGPRIRRVWPKSRKTEIASGLKIPALPPISLAEPLSG